MASGGARMGAGRPKLGHEKNRKARKSKSRWVIETRINELLRRDVESAKAEAARLAVQLLPYDEPRLNAVTAQVENIHYVARIPLPITDVDEWQKVAKATLLLPDK